MEWSENIIIVDADYVDRVAFDLTVNFERMIGRRIPPADMARWVECIALDGGMRPQDGDAADPGGGASAVSSATQVVLVHDDGRERMENFAPGSYADELNGKAFTGRLGEFVFTCTTPSGLTTKGALLQETLQLACQAAEVKRIMVVPSDEQLDGIRRVLRNAGRSEGRSVTVFAMQPIAGGPFAQEILGYSLMAALGVKGSELHPDQLL